MENLLNISKQAAERSALKKALGAAVSDSDWTEARPWFSDIDPSVYTGEWFEQTGRRLRISALVEAYLEIEQHCMTSGENMPPARILMGLLLEALMIERTNSAIIRELRQLALPESFKQANIRDFYFSPEVDRTGMDRSQLATLATCDWVTGKGCLLLLGPAYIGKTYIGAMLCITAILRRLRVCCLQMGELAARLQNSPLNELYSCADELKQYDLVMFDDFGRGTASDAMTVFLTRYVTEILHERNAALICSQRTPQEWLEDWFRPAHRLEAESIIIRLTQNSMRFDLKGEPINSFHVMSARTAATAAAAAPAAATDTPQPESTPRKKRGRPSKAEIAAREASRHEGREMSHG